MDDKKLLKYAVYYLSKYDSSKKNLVNVLKRKIIKINLSNIEKNKLFGVLEEIILKLEKNDLINDNRYAQSKILSFSNAGKSEKYIFNYLINKGINKSILQNILLDFKNNNDEWELDSAKIFARKKRILESNDSYNKKLAKLARAGFSYEICKKIIG